MPNLICTKCGQVVGWSRRRGEKLKNHRHEPCGGGEYVLARRVCVGELGNGEQHYVPVDGREVPFHESQVRKW